MQVIEWLYGLDTLTTVKIKTYASFRPDPYKQ